MPKQAETQDAAESAAAASEHVVTVAAPTVGRVVLVNVGGYGQEPILRPGVVLDAGVLGHVDAVTVAVFLTAADYPLPPGLSIRAPEIGTPSYPAKAPWQIEACRYGDLPGQWRWPERSDDTFTIEQ